MIKKVVRVFLALFLLLVVAVVALPFVFKGKLVNMVKSEVNKQVNATVEFGTFDLSLISSFPDFYFEINDVKITGIDTFRNVELAKIGQLNTTIDLMSIISGGDINIKSFGLENTYLHVLVLKNGMANYDIAKPSTDTSSTVEADTSAVTPIKVGLKNYYLKNFNLVYDDKDLAVFTEIKGLDHQGKGDFTLDDFILETNSTIQSFTTDYEGVRYFNKVKSDIKMDIGINMPNFRFEFKDNSLSLNSLVLKFDGYVAMPSDDIDMDISFSAPENTFKSVLSLIPSIYAKDFEGIETSGNFALSGFAKGVYNDTQLPAFALDLKVKDGRFKYPDLPKSAENIQIDLKIDNDGTGEDATVIDLSTFHLELGTNPIDFNFYLKNPVSDPDMRGLLQAQIDFATLADVIPSEGETYSGSFTANVMFEGLMSTLEEERYTDFKASGDMILLNFNYNDSSIGYPVEIRKAIFKFSPQALDLEQLDLIMGKSDLAMQGKVYNYLPYYFMDSTLTANLTMQSSYMDADELMGEEEVEEETAEASADSTAEELYEVTEIPKNIRFTSTAKIDKMKYDGMEMTNMNGGLSVKDGRVLLDKFNMNMLGGSIGMTGEYNTLDVNKPFYDFAMNMQKLDVQQTFNTFNTVQKLAPIAENAKGAFSCGMSATGYLDRYYEPDLNTLSGGGVLTTHMVVIGGSNFLEKAANALKNDKYKQVELNDVKIAFTFADGKVELKPFDVKVGDSKATIQGANYFDERIDYVINMEVPTSEFGGAGAAATSALQSLLGQAGLNAAVGDKIKMDLLVTGTVTDPKISPRLAGSGAAQSTKDQAKQLIDDKKQELEDKAKQELDKAKQQAEAEKAKRIAAASAKGDQLIAQAEQQATTLRTEAKAKGDQLIKEAEAQRQKLIKDAGANPVKKKAAEVAGDKLVKEAKEQANKLNQEADQKANSLVQNAKAQKQKLIDEASAL